MDADTSPSDEGGFSEEELLAADRAYNERKRAIRLAEGYELLVRREVLELKLRGMGEFDETQPLLVGIL